MKYHTSGIH